jgi:sugar lactone lactonase YvrE
MVLTLAGLNVSAAAAAFQIVPVGAGGSLMWTNVFTDGICTVEATGPLVGTIRSNAWQCQQSFFATNAVGAGAASLSATQRFFRVLAVDVSAGTPVGFTNLVHSYGLLHTVAGSGNDPGTDDVNYWQSGFEGGFATNAALSRPHFAMADGAKNIFIVDKNSFSVLKVTPDGLIHTVAGTHATGNGPDTATPALNVALNQPNGLWVRNDGTFYVLDTGNNKVRRVDTNGVMTTLFTDSKSMGNGRGLWVRNDEQLIYYCAGTDFRQWTPTGGILTLNKKFNDLGCFVLTANGTIVVTDRGANTVWSVNPNGGSRTLLYGDGGTNLVADGTLALTNSLYGVRGIWIPPFGGYLLATDYGEQFLYVDASGIIHVLMSGSLNMHAGDGQWFYSPGYKLGQMRSVSMDNLGNILLVENDLGYVRKIDFHRLFP